MMMNAIAVLLLIASGMFFYGDDEDPFTDHFSVNQELLSNPRELLLVSEVLQSEGNLKGAFLCWKLLKETRAPWTFRAPALLRLASYYQQEGKREYAKECLQLVMQQDEVLSAKLAAQERFDQFDHEGPFFLSDDEL